MKDNLSGYRRGVGIVLCNPLKQVLIARRIKEKAWQFPQGGIDPGESDETAMFREMMEELGTKKGSIIHQTQHPLTYDFPSSLSHPYPHKGQSIQWFLLNFEGNDNDININTLHPEFDMWKWVDFHEAIQQIVDFKKDMYKKIYKEFLAMT
jgi:putative (di)nucleoside polyphosphate hydrolase